MDEAIFDEIVQFIYFQRWKYKRKLMLSTTIESDLGITGDDADEFMAAFVEKFNLNPAEFDIGKYFSSEGFDPIGLSIFLKKLFRMPIQKRSSHELTIGDLVKWVKNGYWEDPL